jgi:hypothetical protein
LSASWIAGGFVAPAKEWKQRPRLVHHRVDDAILPIANIDAVQA